MIPNILNFWENMAMIDTIELLQKIDFFAALEPRIVKKVADVCIPKTYAKGDYLIRQGETGLGLFFVIEGHLTVEVERDGHRITVAELRSEDFVGELAVIDNKPRSANVICAEDTRCLVLTRDSFLKLMNKYPQIAIQMAKSLSARLRSMDEFISEKRLHTAPPESSAVPEPAGEPAAAGAAAETGGETKAAAPAGSQSVENGTSTKDKVRDFMIDTFSHFYTVKAMTRFSVAVIGCPIHPGNGIREKDFFKVELGDVKVTVFPSSRERDIHLKASGSGPYSITVLRPSQTGFDQSRFSGKVTPHDRLTLRVPSDTSRVPELLEGLT